MKGNFFPVNFTLRFTFHPFLLAMQDSLIGSETCAAGVIRNKKPFE